MRRRSVYRFECDPRRYASAAFGGSDDEYRAWTAQLPHLVAAAPIELRDDGGLLPLAPFLEPYLGYGLFCLTPLAGDDLVSAFGGFGDLCDTTLPGFRIVNVTRVVDCLDPKRSGRDGAGLPERYVFDAARLPGAGLFRIPQTGEVLMLDDGVERSVFHLAAGDQIPGLRPRLLWDTDDGPVEHPHRMLWDEDRGAR